MPCALVEKAVFGLLRICQRLLPYKENIADELLRSLQLVMRLDALVADAYCEQITQEVGHLVKSNASHIRSQLGWRKIVSLLSITAGHLEASEDGFDALLFIMSGGAHLLPANYILCADAARQFAESRVGQSERCIQALDLMSGSVNCLTKWTSDAKQSTEKEQVSKMLQDIGDMWLRLLQGLKKLCLDQREDVRNHALFSLQKCLAGAVDINLNHGLWLQCFDLVIFPVLDDLLEIALKLLSKVFLQSFQDLSKSTAFIKLWLAVLSRMEKYMKVKIRGRRSEKLQELVPELLKNSLLVMKSGGILVQNSVLSSNNSLWELTWQYVNNILPSLKSEVFPEKDSDSENLQQKKGEKDGDLKPGENISVPSKENAGQDGVGIG